MKTIVRFFLLFAVAAAFASAADPVVAIDSATNVYIDGVNFGQPADVIANNPKIAPLVQTALVGFVKKTETDAAAAKAVEVAAVAATRDAQLASCAAYIALLQKTIRDLGGKVPDVPDVAK